LTLNFEKAHLLKYQLEIVEPSYLKNDINITHIKEKNHLIVNFKDIKSQEYFEFSVYIDGELKEPLDAYIRIKGIDKLNTVNYIEKIQKDREEATALFTKRYTFVLVLLWILVLLLLFFLIIAVVQEFQRKDIKKKVKKSGLKFDSFSVDDLIEFVQNDMKWLTTDKKSKISNHISDISEQKKTLIKLEINDNSILIAFWFLLIFSLIPFYYLYLHYFS